LRLLAARQLELLVAHGLAERPREVVDGRESVDAVADVFGESLVGSRHVGPEGVAADGGQLDGAQHRAQRWDLAPRHVAVPDVLVALDGIVLGKSHDLRQIAGGKERVYLELAPQTREFTLLRRRDALVAKENHLPVEKRLVKVGM